jgi:hypothetical protein
MTAKFIACKTRYQAIKRCPWATAFSKVEGGYMAFASVLDRRTWRAQR